MNICLASQLLHCILAWLKHCIEQHPGQDCNFPLIIHNLHVFWGLWKFKRTIWIKKNIWKIFRRVVFYNKRVATGWPWWDWTKLPHCSRLGLRSNVSFYSFVYKLSIREWGVMLFKTSRRKCFHIIRKSLFLILCSFILFFQMTSLGWCCRRRGMIISMPVMWRYGSLSVNLVLFLFNI